MILTVIGCTGSFAGPDSPASCYLLTGTDHEGRTWRVLMDLGNGSLGALQRHIELSKIDAVLISHLHPDHCVDLAGLHVAVKWDPRGWEAGPVPVWGPAGMMDYMEAAHVLDSAETIENEFTIGQWEDGRAVEIGPFRITPHRVEHPVEDPFALRVEYDGADGSSVLTYSGDSDACEGLTEAARNADLFLCEAAYHEGRDAYRGIHLTGLRAGQTADDADADELMLTHLPVWNSPTRSVREAAEAFTGPISLAQPSTSYRIVADMDRTAGRVLARGRSVPSTTTTMRVIDPNTRGAETR
ncbi:MBL fold metallo-hydrolase [Kocuria palustris]|uniref:MBL fold metallo-hydrolase n=1 Tax=Kocuria palustris TaxID=71999 RepID=UPI00246865EE|nr:MBL fold metallo-hydrolase [Kocuria palustris]MDH5152847.1 MBL fold metallo-hydrolase [Kocuria palustris]